VTQERSVNAVREIELTKERRNQMKLALTPGELTCCRSVLGELLHYASNTCPWLSAPVSLLQGEISVGDGSTLLKINKLVRTAKSFASQKLWFRPVTTLCVVVFTDASWATRSSGHSQGGYLCGIADESILHGQVSPVSLTSWSSCKLPRVARGSLGCEAQGCAIGQEEAEYTRALLAELSTPNRRVWRDWADIAREIKGTTVVDNKTLFDALKKNQSASLGIDDRRTAIECISLRQGIQWTDTDLKWVHSLANPADGMTKDDPKALESLMRLITKGYWRIVYDPEFLSSRQRVKKGLSVKE